MPQNVPLNEDRTDLRDKPGFVRNLRNILSTVSVRGPQDVHNMDLVLSGLQVLHDSLSEEKHNGG